LRFRGFVALVQSDLRRHTGAGDLPAFLRCMLEEPGFACTFWLRAVTWLRAEDSSLRLLWPLAGLFKHRLEHKYGVSFNASTPIGPGFRLVHVYSVGVSENSSIGCNCTMMHEVTLGEVERGPRKGSPQIGDDVFIGAGAKILGRITIGSNVAIGANAVVTKDVPDNAVVGGVPATILSYGGAAELTKH
jgi:serine O-acetyltransferase